jgi:PKD repeat protein
MLPGVLLAVALLASPVAAATMTEYLDTNLEGGDYLTVAAPAKEDCSNACLNDQNCLAATWVFREFSQPSCWLKNSVPAKTPHSNQYLIMHSYIKEFPPPSGGGCWGIAPSVRYDVIPTSGPAPLTIVFSNFSQVPPGTIITNDPGSTNPADGGMSLSSGISYYTYHDPGTYQWTTTHTNPCGISDTKTTTITVLPLLAPPSGSGCSGITPRADITASTTSGPAPLTVTFTDTSSGVTGNACYKCDVAWLSGTNPKPVTTSPPGLSFTETFTSPGSYQKMLRIGCSEISGTGKITDTKIVTITVLPPVSGGGCSGIAPNADFSAAPASGPAPLTVTLTDLATGATNCSWGVMKDDPSKTFSGPCPYHSSFTYTNPGVYLLTHTASDACGSSDTKTATITVLGPSQTMLPGPTNPPGPLNKEPAGTRPAAGGNQTLPTPAGTGGGNPTEHSNGPAGSGTSLLLLVLCLLILIVLAAAAVYHYRKKKKSP